MTGKEQLEYAETRAYVYNRAGGYCQVCGNRLNWQTFQLAHKIPQDKRNVKRWGKKVIHHPLNLKATCSQSCNDRVSIRNHPVAQMELIQRIKEAL